MTPDGWQIRPLAETATLQRGFDLPVQDRREGTIPVVASNGPVGTHAVAQVKGPGVITGRSGTIGKVFFYDSDFWPLNTTLYVSDFHANDPRFVASLLTAFGLEKYAASTGVPSLNRNFVHHVPVLVPPLGEQRKIAAILSSVDDAIEATQAVIDQLQVVKKAMMAELLTRGLPGRHARFKQTEIGEVPQEWVVTPLGELATFITSGSRGWSQYYAVDGALFVRSQNIRAGFLDLADRAFVRPPGGAEGERTKLLPDDILVTITGNSVGNVCVGPPGLGDAYVSQHVGLVRLTDRSLAPFMAEFLAPGSPGNQQVLAAQYGQSKPGLSLGNLRAFLVPVPPEPERVQILSALQSAQSRIGTESKYAFALLAMKSALMSVLLTGELRVTPDEVAA